MPDRASTNPSATHLLIAVHDVIGAQRDLQVQRIAVQQGEVLGLMEVLKMIRTRTRVPWQEVGLGGAHMGMQFGRHALLHQEVGPKQGRSHGPGDGQHVQDVFIRVHDLQLNGALERKAVVREELQLALLQAVPFAGARQVGVEGALQGDPGGLSGAGHVHDQFGPEFAVVVKEIVPVADVAQRVHLQVRGIAHLVGINSSNSVKLSCRRPSRPCRSWSGSRRSGPRHGTRSQARQRSACCRDSDWRNPCWRPRVAG